MIFFNFHPQQPYQDVTFNPMKAYFRRENGVTFKRQWLTYYQQKNSFYCSFCLAFGNEIIRLTIGCTADSNNNPTTRIKEHESSLSHKIVLKHLYCIIFVSYLKFMSWILILHLTIFM